MEVLIQRTKTNYFLITENITRETFWNLFKSGCDEHLVLHKLRKSNCYISNLDMVALSENRIIGHIITTKAKVVDKQNNEHQVLCVGPISVLPEFQKKGIGVNCSLGRNICTTPVYCNSEEYRCLIILS